MRRRFNLWLAGWVAGKTAPRTSRLPHRFLHTRGTLHTTSTMPAAGFNLPPLLRSYLDALRNTRIRLPPTYFHTCMHTPVFLHTRSALRLPLTLYRGEHGANAHLLNYFRVYPIYCYLPVFRALHARFMTTCRLLLRCGQLPGTLCTNGRKQAWFCGYLRGTAVADARTALSDVRQIPVSFVTVFMLNTMPPFSFHHFRDTTPPSTTRTVAFPLSLLCDNISTLRTLPRPVLLLPIPTCPPATLALSFAPPAAEEPTLRNLAFILVV